MLDDDTRIAHSDAMGRNVFNDYASGSDGAAVADCNGRLVKDYEIEVCKEPPADLDMLPVITMEWRVYECVVIGLTQDLLQFLIP